MIKLLLDQNLSPKTTSFLRDLGWDVVDLRELGRAAASDEEVYGLAKGEGRVVVTYDLDFSRRYMAHRDLPGLILLRVHPQTVEVLHPILKDFLRRVKPEELEGAIATVEPHRYRIRRV